MKEGQPDQKSRGSVSKNIFIRETRSGYKKLHDDFACEDIKV